MRLYTTRISLFTFHLSPFRSPAPSPPPSQGRGKPCGGRVFNSLTLQLFYSSTLLLFNFLTFQLFNFSTLQLFNCSTIQLSDYLLSAVGDVDALGGWGGKRTAKKVVEKVTVVTVVVIAITII